MSWGYLLLALLPDTLPGALISWSELESESAFKPFGGLVHVPCKYH